VLVLVLVLEIVALTGRTGDRLSSARSDASPESVRSERNRCAARRLSDLPRSEPPSTIDLAAEVVPLDDSSLGTRLRGVK
jgi:hypothetical protein